MKRSFRRARKPTYRRKKSRRFFKKRVTRYNKPDTGYSEKVTYRGTLDVVTADNAAWLNIHWGGGSATGSSPHDLYLHDQV